jgi:hypothetical protein
VFQQGKVPWARWAVEFVLILGSVYLAVFLESAQEAAGDRDAAQQALSQLLGELREDQADFERIIAVQDALHRHYENLARWLEDPSDYPVDSVGAALIMVATENPTLFPRRASWNTMISAGQLADLSAPELVAQLGQLYENAYDRIDYNNRLYDEALNGELRETDAIRWHDLERRPLREDTDEVRRLSARLERIHVAWNVWYRDLLIEHEDDVGAAITSVEAYLDAEGA